MTRMVTIFVVAALFGLSLYQQGDKVKDVFEQEVSWISHTLIEEEEEEVPDAVKESLPVRIWLSPQNYHVWKMALRDHQGILQETTSHRTSGGTLVGGFPGTFTY